MRDTLKPSLHCKEKPYNIEFCTNLGHCLLGVGTFLMHAECKAATETLWWNCQPTQQHLTWFICRHHLLTVPKPASECYVREHFTAVW